VDDYFVRTDAALGELARLAGPDTVVIAVSDHGSGPMPPVVFRPTVWLEQAGLLRRRPGALARPRALRLFGLALDEAKRRGLTGSLKAMLPPTWVDGARAIARHDAFVDLTRTRAYPVDHFYPLAGFEVNLRGRQPAGIVAPQEYESIRDEVIQGLLGSVLPDGRPLCRRVCRREELFAGPRAEVLADVIAELDLDVDARLGFAQGMFEPNAGHPGYPYRGYHRREGALAIRGPGIRPGRDLSGSELRDVVPTLLHLLDLPVPPDRRGTPFPVLEG
ncbi:MAG TPA: hypothetical protein VLD61_02075, partial [Methylomirabilota bacterium]|nr:hypothetical protein [Methylomirabilota bacterium]